MFFSRFYHVLNKTPIADDKTGLLATEAYVKQPISD